MKVAGSGSVGLLVLEADAGEEIVSATATALRENGALFAWVVAHGRLREALIETSPQGSSRAVEGKLEIASASGLFHAVDGSLALAGVLSREVDGGAEAIAGRIAVGVAEAVQVLCFLGSPPAPAPAPRRGEASPAPSPAPSDPGLGRTSAPMPTATAPTHSPAHPTVGMTVPAQAPSNPGPPIQALPPKPQRKSAGDAANFDPEPGDHVTHFAFGECTVESFDGDRIRLKQDKDERVREVSLTMLRIEAGERHADGHAQYLLLRKN